MHFPPEVLLLLIFVIVIVLYFIVREKRIVSSQTSSLKVRIRNAEDAEAVYTETLRRYPNKWQASYNRARVRWQQGNGNGAFEDINRAISLNPRFASSFSLRGDILVARGEFADAERDYREVLSLHTKPAQKAYVISRLGYLKYSQYDRVKPQSDPAHARLLDEALTYFEDALRINSNEMSALSGKAQVFRLRGDLQAALTVYEEGLRVSPNSPTLLLDRGVVYAAQGNLDAAIADCDKSISLNGNSAMAYNNRGYTRALLGSLDKALEDCNRALELSPGLFNAFASRGMTYYLMGHFEESLADFQQALDLRPEHSGVMAGKAICLYRLDRNDEAKAQWQALLKFDPEYQDVGKLKCEYYAPDVFVEEARKVNALLQE